MIKTVCTIGLFALALGLVPIRAEAQGNAGQIRFIKRAGSELDRYTDTRDAGEQDWMRTHFSRLAGVFSPYFDSKLSWYPNAWAYIDLYSIKPNTSLANDHPDWILRDGNGQPMYIPWGCGGGSCPQFAGDITNGSFRAWWIGHARDLLAKGYKGLWIDDVNMQLRVGDNWGTEKPPIDPRTGTTMTWDDWRRYIAEFVEQIRAELPQAEILHNSIWFAGPSNVRDADGYVRRQIAAADFINCERGISDGGLNGGDGEWSLNAFFAYVDRIHAAGKHVVFDDYFPSGLEYPMAGYLLISDGTDGMGELISNRNNWWRGYDVNLGPANGARYSWNGLLRRDFQGGMVLLNLPGAPQQTVSLPGVFNTIDGMQVSSVTLGGSQGMVLTGTGGATAAPASPGVRYLSDMNPQSAVSGWGPVEKDRSNNDFRAGDGNAVRINGTAYGKGLGAHSNSEVRYTLGGSCSSFQADVGVDDEVPAGWGSIVFQVWADGNLLFDSGRMTRGSPAQPVNLPLNGRNEISLVINDAGDGITWDHGDWADARLNCSFTQ